MPRASANFARRCPRAPTAGLTSSTRLLAACCPAATSDRGTLPTVRLSTIIEMTCLVVDDFSRMRCVGIDSLQRIFTAVPWLPDSDLQPSFAAAGV